MDVHYGITELSGEMAVQKKVVKDLESQEKVLIKEIRILERKIQEKQQ